MSYHQFVTSQRRNNPCLAGLDDFLSSPSSDRRRCRIRSLDFTTTHPHPISRQINLEDVQETLLRSSPIDENDKEGRRQHGRILIIEDLCQGVIELLGARYRIDPIFFASHLHAPFRQMVAQTPNLAILPSRKRTQNFVNFHYHRTVELKGVIKNERMLTRDMNVSRKVALLLPIQETQIALVQHTCSIILLEEAEPGRGWLGIILVDAPIPPDHLPMHSKTNEKQTKDKHPPSLRRVSSKLFLNGYEDFLSPVLPSTFNNIPDPNIDRAHTTPLDDDNDNDGNFLPRSGLLADLTFCWERQSRPEPFSADHPTLFALSSYPLRIIAAEWNIYLAAMTHHIKHHEAAVETIYGLATNKLDKLKEDLRSLQIWRRRSLASQQKIASIKHFITAAATAAATLPQQPNLNLPPEVDGNPRFNEAAASLLEDYSYLAGVLEVHSVRLGNMLPVVTSLVQISDSRQSLKEAANVSRLTSLAFFFIPLSFTTGLFSMNRENAPGGAYFWVFFIVAVPITLLVFCVARPEILGWLGARLRPLRAVHLPV